MRARKYFYIWFFLLSFLSCSELPEPPKENSSNISTNLTRLSVHLVRYGNDELEFHASLGWPLKAFNINAGLGRFGVVRVSEGDSLSFLSGGIEQIAFSSGDTARSYTQLLDFDVSDGVIVTYDRPEEFESALDTRVELPEPFEIVYPVASETLDDPTELSVILNRSLEERETFNVSAETECSNGHSESFWESSDDVSSIVYSVSHLRSANKDQLSDEPVICQLAMIVRIYKKGWADPALHPESHVNSRYERNIELILIFH